MKFIFNNFTSDVEIFNKDNDDFVVRFYDKAKEQNEDEIINLVIVDPGYGYISLKIKGEGALLSGFLDEDIFITEEMVDAAINYIEDLIPHAKNRYMPYHVVRFKKASYVEYNGEY
ncbi:hypothetical protein [Paenibacillus oleatilyticus]|uniref:hypothetical protein n=1 Tax=Paenibacillus oleatilyticus TaxID=2594886 RepID=UPI001C1FF1BA|nr:hypothetical protein [Paenibacillus oleatilyticus]MBU7318898.1 hypothetical protein [Paenibacillus oleatilyticus]